MNMLVTTVSSVWPQLHLLALTVVTTASISSQCVYAVMYPLCFLPSFTTPESRGPVSRCGRQADWGSQVEDDEMRRDVHRDMQR